MPTNRTTGTAPHGVTCERWDLTDDQAERCRASAGSRSYRVQSLTGNSLTNYIVPGSHLAAFLPEHNQRDGEEVVSVELAGHDGGLAGAAHHEAGHAVACCERGITFRHAWVDREMVPGCDGGTTDMETWPCGRCPSCSAEMITPTEGDCTKAHDGLVARFAGALAERRFLLLRGTEDGREVKDGQELGTTIARSGSQDQERANGTILDRILFCSPEQRAEFREAAEWDAQRLVQEHWDQIERVAKALLKCEERKCGLTQEEVECRRRGRVAGMEADGADEH